MACCFATEAGQRVGAEVGTDPQLETLTIQLATTAARNTASSIVDRITVAKKSKKEQETIAELEQILNELLSDKSELYLIAQAYEQELVAQRISATDIEYVSERFVPLVRQFIGSAAIGASQDAAAASRCLASFSTFSLSRWLRYCS